ncbi:MAG: hypothetical protein LBR31_08865 [Desulfovibrio sp.]|jgi:hypothetical protein|nr:hypothetical protein [Desulfovibrio sp.]
MSKHCALLVWLALSLAGCASERTQTLQTAGADAPVVSGGVNLFNPWLNTTLPNSRRLSADGEQMAKQIGSGAQRIEGEAAYRKRWREELYPVVFGDMRAPHEILVLLDFAAPQSEKVWQAVVDAAKSLSPKQIKIVVYGNSREQYGTDLLGFAIWLSWSRPEQAMPWLSHALSRWNAVKAEQKRLRGRSVPFVNEFDATAKPEDYPIIYTYMQRLRPPVSANDELEISRYCYDAGNVNMYQAAQIGTYYGVKAFPAVIVDGRPLGSPGANSILAALE